MLPPLPTYLRFTLIISISLLYTGFRGLRLKIGLFTNNDLAELWDVGGEGKLFEEKQNKGHG